MSRRSIESGDRYGRLVASMPDVHSTKKHQKWFFVCDCGNRKSIALDSVFSSKTRSCGCLRKEIHSEKFRTDHVGKRFGGLLVLEYAGSLYGGPAWLCQCDCGALAIKAASDLVDGRVKSCGCRLTLRRVPIEQKRARHVIETARRRALKKDAGGTFTTDEIARLYDRQRGRCAWCYCPLGDSFHRDHRVALSCGGDNGILNIELLCGPCNLKKGAKDPIKWAQEIGRLI